MKVLERRVQKDIRDQNAYLEWERKWEAIEKRLGGFPAKRHYGLMSGTEDFGTVVWERDWESLAAMETAYDRMLAEPEAASLGEKFASIYRGERIEYYWIM